MNCQEAIASLDSRRCFGSINWKGSKVKFTIFGIVCIAFLLSGCSAGKVAVYGPEMMVYNGSSDNLNWACRTALQEMGVKEGAVWPNYGEGCSTNTTSKGTVTKKTYFTNKDINGIQYTITKYYMGKKDPIVILETTGSNKFILLDALITELKEREIKVNRL